MSWSVAERPPLFLSYVVTSPTGKTYRWSPDDTNPRNVPSGVRFSDTMPGGFEALDATLPRQLEYDYPDLERLSTITAYGVGGAVAGEFRLERAPRTSGDQFLISPSAVGWQAHLEDDKQVQYIYVDQDVNRWYPPSEAERARLIAAGRDVASATWQAVDGGIVCELPNMALSGATNATFWYAMPSGCAIGAVMYRGTESLPGTVESARFFIATADPATGVLANVITLDGTLRTLTPIPTRYIFADLYFAGTGATPAAGANRRFSQIALYGNHGLTRQTLSGEPSGLLASDVVQHAITNWAPLLKYTAGSSVLPSTFVISHLVFPDATTAAEIVRQSARFSLEDWAVWGDRTFFWGPRGAFARQWRARVGPSGLEEAGPQVDRLWNGVVVQYQDVDGGPRVVGPIGSGVDTESALLADSDTTNPANVLGIRRWERLQMGVATAAAATEVGRRFLEESKALSTAGQATITGYVESDAGTLYPYWAIRAGDYISFVDANDPSPRRVVRTTKDVDARTCAIDLDAPPDALSALLERLDVTLFVAPQSDPVGRAGPKGHKKR